MAQLLTRSFWQIVYPRVLPTLVVLLLAQIGCANSAREDSLDYAIYALKDDSERELLTEGTLTCDGSNVQTIERSFFGQPFWQKYVRLPQDLGKTALRNLDPTRLGPRMNSNLLEWFSTHNTVVVWDK